MPLAQASEAERGERDAALDVARGIAVLSMVWVHFVPEPGEGSTGWLPALQWASVHGLDGLPAAMFMLLVGMGIAVGGHDVARSARRAVALACIGLPFWWFVWPNDILIPIACTLPITALSHRAGKHATALTIGLLLALVPLATHWFGDYAWTDVREDGTHEANHSLGWHTLRYFLFDGAYPLLPWLVFPLAGTLLLRARSDARSLRRWCAAGAVLAMGAIAVDQTWGDQYLGGIHAHCDITWQPTSLPFVFAWGGAAVLVVALICLGLPEHRAIGRLGCVAAVGRTSLSHYLMHLVLVYGGLRLWWPEEDWSTTVGLVAFCGYASLALAGSPWWLSRFRRGPLEACMARAATRTRAGVSPRR